MKDPTYNGIRFLGFLLSFLFLIGPITTIGTDIFASENRSESDQKGGQALKSSITNMNLSGYVGDHLTGNIQNWQISAYQNNRGIIEQIAIAASGGASLDRILGTDYFGVDSYYTIDIRERNGEKVLGWTLQKLPGDFSDRDFKFASDKTALTDWSGAEELLVRVDASEIPTSTQVRIAFEENAVGRESYALIDGTTVYLSKSDQTKTAVTVAAGGYIPLPPGFTGSVILPLNTDTFYRYFESGGNNRLDLSRVVQFQLSVKGDAEMVGKTFYLQSFAIVGAINDNPLSQTSSATPKTVWNMENLSGRLGYTGAITAWYGEFVGKLLTGMAYSYRAVKDETLKTAAEDIITDLAAAQGTDGYLGVFLGGARYALSSDNWDLWNQYHCITGLLEWYTLTANPTALDVAKKALDCIYQTLKDRSYIVAGGFETNRSIAHGYAQMYQITKDSKYLREAIRIIEEDCRKNDVNGWYNYALAGKDFYTSSCSRWEILHMVMTLGILYEETGNTEYYNVMGAVWENILQTDIHNTGGFTTDEGACGNPYAEGIIETCCTIAWAALTNEYLKYNPTVRVADELERTYLNALLGSLLDDDKYCTYNTPMDGIPGSSTLHGGVYDGRRVPSQEDISFQYNTGSPDMNCCQANLARGLGQLSQWAILGNTDELYLNYYGPSSIETQINGKPITLTQTTEYPQNGKIKLLISGLEQDTAFALHLRIPTWAYGSRVTLDGRTHEAPCGEYFTIKKTWKNGDTVILDLALSFTYWTGEKEQSGFASVYYGPILLTLDEDYAPSYDQTLALDTTTIESAKIQSGKETGALLIADLTVKGKSLRLVDFSSAGKYNGGRQPSRYWSWLTVTDAPSVKPGVTWLNTEKHRITFGENILFDKALAYAGDSVSFTVKIPKGSVLDSITASSSAVSFQKEGSTYRFMMPDEDVTIAVTWKETEDGSSKKNRALPVLLAIATVATITAAVAIPFILKKKRQKKSAASLNQ